MTSLSIYQKLLLIWQNSELESSSPSGLTTQSFWEWYKVYKSDVKESTDVDIDCKVITQHRYYIFIIFLHVISSND